MAKVVKAKRDFEVVRSADKIAITSFSVRTGRTFISFLVYIPFSIIFILSFIALLMALSEGESEMIGLGSIMAGVSGFILFLTAKWASKKKPSVVFIDKIGVIKNGSKYPFTDIDGLRWRFGDQSSTVKFHAQNSLASTGAEMMNEVSGAVEIDYGNKCIVLVTGLSRINVEKAYAKIKSAMQEMGYSFQDG
jgi:hypothetical protein